MTRIDPVFPLVRVVTQGQDLPHPLLLSVLNFCTSFGDPFSPGGEFRAVFVAISSDVTTVSVFDCRIDILLLWHDHPCIHYAHIGTDLALPQTV